MAMNFVEFERPIAELEAKIEELRLCVDDEQLNISSEIETLKAKVEKLTDSIFNKLTPIQVTQLARHPDRPYTLDYINALFSDFEELHGDRNFADDPAIVGGLARFNGQPCVVIGHQKGRDTREKVRRNFGMPKPEGYRKALRLMELADRFQLPLFTFVDTPGAYPGIDAEERGQSQAIAKNLYVMSQLKVPVITTVIGEGGSGGALALAVADQVLMLQYAVYAVISPEGCAAILWRDATSPQEGAQIAADNLGITADRLLELDMIDEVVTEPRGGCHRDFEATFNKLKSRLAANLTELEKLSVNELLDRRHQRLMSYGKFTEN